MVETTIKYDINEDKENIAENLSETARLAGVTLGNGNISVNGEKVDDIIFAGDLDVQISSDTAIVTYLEPNLENFVQAVSMQGGTAQITDGLLDINVPTPDFNGFVNNVSVRGGSGNISGNTLNLTIPEFKLQNANVHNVSIVGNAGVIIDGDTAIINVTGGGVSKLNPNLTVTPNPVIFNAYTPSTATITANSNSDAILQFLRYGDITMDTISPTQVEIKPNVLTGSAQVQVFSPENADYYGQYKVVDISMAFTPTIDFYVENGEIKSQAGNEWLTSGSDISIANSYIEVANQSYVYTNVNEDTDFSATPFTLIMEFTPISFTTTNAGALSVFQETGQPGIRGIGFQYYGQSCQILITKDSGWINLANLPMTLGEEMQVKIVRDMVKASVYLNGEFKGSSQGLTNNPLSKVSDKIALGQNVTVWGARNYIKSFRVYKNIAI